MTTLKSEIIRFAECDAEQADAILDSLRPVRLEKGRFLLIDGQVCESYFFVASGALRLYYHKNDQDYTAWIATPGQIFTDLESYLSESRSRMNIEAIEPSLVLTILKRDSDRLAQTSPAYNTLLRRTVEEAFVNLSKNVISFQSDEAIERYRRLEAEKNWLGKFPLKYISSFIGITQSSLSRVRANKR
ncbi:Crp/Fnr family transcriptional regulator [uncultured Fibrella sp.]|uniref:Crp/Fnr family transcriptional regulator n=1 Tax=uncultured Fibrella sp. TaxID=1284596 RepID=UPI0035CAD1E5